MTAVMSEQELWHRCLGHLYRKGMRILNNGLVTGVKYVEVKSVLCIICLKEKQVDQKFPKSKSWRASNLLELVHSDVAGPMEESSWARYCLIFIDDSVEKFLGICYATRVKYF